MHRQQQPVGAITDWTDYPGNLLETAFGTDAVQAHLAELLNAKHGRLAGLTPAADPEADEDAGSIIG